MKYIKAEKTPEEKEEAEIHQLEGIALVHNQGQKIIIVHQHNYIGRCCGLEGQLKTCKSDQCYAPGDSVV